MYWGKKIKEKTLSEIRKIVIKWKKNWRSSIIKQTIKERQIKQNYWDINEVT